MATSIDQVKEQLIQASQDLLTSGLMFRGYHANLSARLDQQRMIMTKGGDIRHLSQDDFVVINLDGTVEEGDINATNAEVVAMHTGVYREKPSIGSVIHTHAPNATAFAVANESIPLAYEPLLRFGVTQPIPVAAWAPRGSDQSVNNIIGLVKSGSASNAVLLANHGVLAFHENPLQTAHFLATLDEAAEVVIKARQISKEVPLPKEAVEQVTQRMTAFGSTK